MVNNKKILIVSQHYYPENFRITDIAETLVKFGNQVTVVCGYPNYPEGNIYPEYKGKNKNNHKREIINGVNVIRCFEIPRKHNKIMLFLNYYSVCLSMKHLCKTLKEEFDFVLVNQTSPVMVGWAGIAYAKKHKVPCLLYCYDLWPDSLAAGGIGSGNPVYKYFYGVSNRIYKNSDKILCTSKSFINYFKSIHKIDESKLYYLPQYCEEIFVSESKPKNSKNLNYVFAGNVGNVQSVETIIKAANLIKDRPDIKIHIVGDGSNLNNCKKMANDYGLNNLVFHGKHPIEEMPEFYSMADAMLLTLSKNKVISNTLPGKAQSYMAFGKPIIGAIDGEAQLIINESKCGICCDAEDFESLAKLFIEFRNYDVEKFGLNASNYYEENFKKEIFFNRLNSFVED